MNGSIKKTDVIIIGAGPVGLFAVFELVARYEVSFDRYPRCPGRTMCRTLSRKAYL